jgi:hypothetical protein
LKALENFIAALDVITGPPLYLNGIMAGVVNVLLTEQTDHEYNSLGAKGLLTNKGEGLRFPAF